tara:strand:+ start:18098 stop:18601 length:504 start_codon:yes stop_codon:yes gene_type:complete
METATPGVLFVCLGNICRSPTAQGVFENLLVRHGVRDQVRVDSCGTSGWHVAEAPDIRATHAAALRGIDISGLRGRQLCAQDFVRYDYILAMDSANLAVLKSQCPQDFQGHLRLFMDFACDRDVAEVPDPYHAGKESFSQVLDLVAAASEGLLQELLRNKHIAHASA